MLLVDDNEATTTLVTAILQREFEVEIARDGLDAVESLKTRQYAAIVLDLRMPQLDGFGVLDFLAANKPADLRRVLIVTAALSKKELDRVRGYDICGIIAKPFEVETLLGAVRQCAGNHDGGGLGSRFFSSGMILLLADMLRQRLM